MMLCLRRAIVIAALSSSGTVAAEGLQPLSAFVASAQQHNPENLEIRATADQAAAQRDAARANYLPSLTAQGVYTRNQYESAFALSPEQSITIQAQNGYDAYFTLAVPLIQVGAWAQHRAAGVQAALAEANRTTTANGVEQRVTQAYYQLLGAEAVAYAADQSLEVARDNLKTVRDRQQLGTASDLDLQRAIASVAGAQQDVANAQQGVVSGRRTLESLSRLAPEPAARSNYREDDLRDEAPLASWMKDGSSLVAVRPAELAVTAADASRDAARAAWLPTIAGQFQEHLTNAGGFSGHDTVYTATVTANWRLDFGIQPKVRAETAGVAIARARLDGAQRAAEDEIFQAWQQVRLGIEKARAARAQLDAAKLAQTIARDRYAGGVATQLEVVQAQRDFFQAAISQVQADFDLQYARALLRLSARRTSDR